jgi:hypothetical protein
MEKLRAIQTAAYERGLVELNRSAEGSVQRLRKREPGSGREIHQHTCIDRMAKRLSVAWKTVPRKSNSETFRDVSKPQEWFASDPVR